MCSGSPDRREILISIAHSLGHRHRHPSESAQYLIKWPLALHLCSPRNPIPRNAFLFNVPINQRKTLNEKQLSQQILDKSPKHHSVVVFSDCGRAGALRPGSAAAAGPSSVKMWGVFFYFWRKQNIQLQPHSVNIILSFYLLSKYVHKNRFYYHAFIFFGGCFGIYTRPGSRVTHTFCCELKGNRFCYIDLIPILTGLVQV